MEGQSLEYLLAEQVGGEVGAMIIKRKVVK